MFTKAKKRLVAIFATAALAVGIALTPSPEKLSDIFSLAGNKDRSSQTSAQAWKDLNRSHSYAFETEHGQDQLPDGNNTISVQLESSLDEFEAVTLQPGSIPSGILEKHGEAAANIMDITADGISQSDVDVRFIETPESLGDLFLDQESPTTQSFMDYVDILSLSMVLMDRGNGISQGDLHTTRDIEQADKLWTSSDMIFVWSAGNNGATSSSRINRPSAFHPMRADAMVRIGEVETDTDGTLRIAGHSSRGGVSFVVKNPYTDPVMDWGYPYIRTAKEARKRIGEFYNKNVTQNSRTALEIFNDQLIIREHIPFITPLPRDANPLITYMDFPGKADLLMPAKWQREHPDRVREAFINGIMASIPVMNSIYGADGNGLIRDLSGTSFSGPYAGGMISGAHELFPQLSEFELIGAALIAAEPITTVKKNTLGGLLAPMNKTVAYSNNGRNLLYNSEEGGFGYVDQTRYIETLQEISDLKNQYPNLSTEQVHASSDVTRYNGYSPVKESPYDFSPSFDNIVPHIPMPDLDFDTQNHQENSATITDIIPAPDNRIMPSTPLDRSLLIDFIDASQRSLTAQSQIMHSHELKVNDDIITMRTNLTLKFAGDQRVPPTIHLINPAGGSIELAPTNINGKNVEYSLGTTDGHFGNHTKGTWRIEFQGNFELQEARLLIHGSKVGGLLDTYLKQTVDMDNVPDYYDDPPAPPPSNGGGNGPDAGNASNNGQNRNLRVLPMQPKYGY